MHPIWDPETDPSYPKTQALTAELGVGSVTTSESSVLNLFVGVQRPISTTAPPPLKQGALSAATSQTTPGS